MHRLPLVNSLTCRRKFRYSQVDVKAARLHPPHQQSDQQQFSSEGTRELLTPTWMPSSRLGERSSGARVWRNNRGLQEDTEVREMKTVVKRRVDFKVPSNHAQKQSQIFSLANEVTSMTVSCNGQPKSKVFLIFFPFFWFMQSKLAYD